MLPVFLQNMSISVYGLYIQKIRHGQQYRDFLRQIKGHLSLSREELEEIQWKVFSNLLADSQKYVPYYREVLKDISVQEVRCIDDMQTLPLLEKEVLRTSPEA